MTSTVPAVVPTSAENVASRQGTAKRALRGPLPLATFTDRRTRRTVYALPAIDCNGRLADQAIVRVMGWEPGTRYAIQEHGGLLLVDANPRGVFAVTRQGHLYIPAVVRRRCAISPAARRCRASRAAAGDSSADRHRRHGRRSLPQCAGR
ncbi:hypothetical protein ACPPVO_43200 [Dactylosporangium sp. McL0621]|uniref:hypothetical protein n=1 Tax=Dactylosporangium sp. McL0621 TaxID=3415678 RepID=UPI003CEBA2B0